ncbi:hypothetical protein [Nocardia arthritidis]|uniref:DUF4259 domain-containing protein n=1 Tax=Nocardia arthritidis TaxID=228602 RepID=A0A6G9YC25_9NOCA|nr:hypothetical protein [Nocardia arthritidis]QIS10752.1 hypothetical protein F5544_14325 [Nocardia arthritidis]
MSSNASHDRDRDPDAGFPSYWYGPNPVGWAEALRGIVADLDALLAIDFDDDGE